MRRVAILITAGLSLMAAAAWAHEPGTRASGRSSHRVHSRHFHKRKSPRTDSRPHRRAHRKRMHRRALAGGLATTLGALAGDPVLFGDQSVESNLDSVGSGTAASFPFSNSTTGSAQSVTVYIDSNSRAPSLLVGVYASNGANPGSLIASGSLAAPQGGAWNTIAIPSTNVSAGQVYWVAVLASGGTLDFRDRSGGPCVARLTHGKKLKSLPGTWASGGSTSGACPISAYVSGMLIVPAPVNTAAPVLTGTPAQGQTLTTTTGAWSNSPSRFTYQWQDCDGIGPQLRRDRGRDLEQLRGSGNRRRAHDPLYRDGEQRRWVGVGVVCGDGRGAALPAEQHGFADGQRDRATGRCAEGFDRLVDRESVIVCLSVAALRKRGVLEHQRGHVLKLHGPGRRHRRHDRGDRDRA